MKQYCIPIRKQYKSNFRLSETQIKKRLEKQGWTVWRGGYLHCTRYDELYPNVKKKYLQYLCAVHHGMPDFFCQRKKEIKFVECKLGNETIKENQKKCIRKLQEYGMEVEVHRFVFKPTKIREAYLDLDSGTKKVTEKQERLKSRYPKTYKKC